MKNQNVIKKPYGAGQAGHAIKTTKLKDCITRYVIIDDIIKYMDGEYKR